MHGSCSSSTVFIDWTLRPIKIFKGPLGRSFIAEEAVMKSKGFFVLGKCDHLLPNTPALKGEKAKE